ncbi:CPBP family glutamic-type intramembrane protease [Aequorivita marina]|uniref:CPBP family glutamic-type intramembrane protease n=1 Tax=Aequorivita marina TaxID=3073654 RepID=UPI0028760BA2|nr:CPBP family glutamic-type intramembrane protease [Aequorivita sp. S2608]MDS1299346.1 CPBP family glutamic-type intramembrane protease [Aequorivita sp. S2608]
MLLWTPLLHLAIILPLLIIAQIFSKTTNPKYLLIFGAYFLADSYLRIVGSKYIELDFLGLDWNWSGAFLALILALVFVLYHKKQIRKDIGFTTRFNKQTLKLGILVFLGFLLFDFIFKMIVFPKGGEFNLEQFMFQATMPGFSEEIVYRGILLWILSKAFVPSKKIKGILFGWGFVIVTFTFAMVHGVVLTETMEIKVDYITIAYITLITSLSLGFLRKFSGNLIFPTLGHNVVNLMNFFIRLL